MKSTYSSLAIAILALTPALLHGAATIVIQNDDNAGVGFNDPTPVAPVGGNAGTTLGQQRLNAIQAAANIWGATLNSIIPIIIRVQGAALPCTTHTAVQGSAEAVAVFRDFAGARPGHWYPAALANKIANVDLDPGNADIRARFNLNLGQPNCLTGTFFYLGLDNNHGSNINLVTLMIHEFAHALGFWTYTSGSTGLQFAGFPTIYDAFLFDVTANNYWPQMTDAERIASAVNTRKLVWTGANVLAAVPQVLANGTPALSISAPASVAGSFAIGTASFGPALTSTGVSGEIMPVVDSPGNIGLACTPLSTANGLAVNGKIALVDRGTCLFELKVQNCQNAGAVAVIVVENDPLSPLTGMSGSGPGITIPSVKISLADGNRLKIALATRSRLRSGVLGSMGTNLSILRGADALGRPFLYTPNPFLAGSSVVHWDTSAFPNLLMEPIINGDVTRNVAPPFDITLALLKDIGWN